MDRERLERTALRWGGLALVVQIWIALHFEVVARRYWIDSRRYLVSLHRFAQRVSQLKPAAFKAPWSFVYLGLFVALMTAMVFALWIIGFREALAAGEPDDKTNEHLHE
jgi:hypothetical protein